MSKRFNKIIQSKKIYLYVRDQQVDDEGHTHIIARIDKYRGKNRK